MNINDIPLGRLKDILASDIPLTIVTTEALIARLEQAEAAVARVRGVHKPVPYRVGSRNTGIPEFVCEACHAANWGAVEHPCPTISALDGEQS